MYVYVCMYVRTYVCMNVCMCMCVTKLRVKDGVCESDVCFLLAIFRGRKQDISIAVYFSAPWAWLASRGPALARKESLLNLK